ncbi:MAG TPA: OmpH family outer membrane protein [Alphaproteobacteria bacterium]
MKALAYVFMAAFAALMLAPTQGHTADLNIAVIDIQTLQKQSKAAQSLDGQIASMRKSFQSEVDGEEKKLRDKEKAILAERPKLKEDELKAKADGFQKEVTASQKKLQDRKTSMEKSIADAVAKLRNEIVKITSAIGKDKGLDLVLMRSSTVIVNEKLDITADVLKALDEQMPDVKI